MRMRTFCSLALPPHTLLAVCVSVYDTTNEQCLRSVDIGHSPPFYCTCTDTLDPISNLNHESTLSDMHTETRTTATPTATRPRTATGHTGHRPGP